MSFSKVRKLYCIGGLRLRPHSGTCIICAHTRTVAMDDSGDSLACQLTQISLANDTQEHTIPNDAVPCAGACVGVTLGLESGPPPAPSPPSPEGTHTVDNTRPRTDTTGAIVNAHQGGITWSPLNQRYYWVGCAWVPCHVRHAHTHAHTHTRTHTHTHTHTQPSVVGNTNSQRPRGNHARIHSP
jgi:hypothetical protein